MYSLPVVLSIAGSDNSAGAGIQADLKTMSAQGVYGVTAVTCVVAEVPGKVSAIQAIEPQIVAEQIRLLFGAFPIRALKTGMLYSRAIMEAVCCVLDEELGKARFKPPIVVDPVMAATSGASLLSKYGVAVYKERLFPMATVVTPNLDEVAALVGRPISSIADMHQAGKELVDSYGSAFLLKGGHLRGTVATDLLFTGSETLEFSAPFVPGVSTHGTGCSYAAAIASGLGRGLGLAEAVGEAKEFVTGAINGFLRWDFQGQQTDALDHFSAVRRGQMGAFTARA